MKILTFTTLYPNAARPRHGIFVENRVRELSKTVGLSVQVVAPCPWFPFSAPFFGQYSKFALVPRSEVRFGISVYHPRYPLFPKIGMNAAPALMYYGVRGAIQRLVAGGGEFDLIDAHYFYPDGVAAIMLGQHFRKPVTITGRGSDLNVMTQYALPRRMIRWAAENAAGIVTVSAALAQGLIRLGIARERVSVLPNGVDLTLFCPGDRATCRAELGLEGCLVLLSVGNLIPLKGHELTVKMLTYLSGARLLIVGDGPQRSSLEQLAKSLSVADRIAFLGSMPQDALPKIYAAADVLILASRHEGCPNVLLEAMACGTPVVVSGIPGMSEIVKSPLVGRLVADRTAQSFAHAVEQIMYDSPSRITIRRYAEDFGWAATTERQFRLFRTILHGDSPRKNAVAGTRWRSNCQREREQSS
jgi:teichuronic acid biosynthesis glycosyltransferase TuaC